MYKIALFELSNSSQWTTEPNRIYWIPKLWFGIIRFGRIMKYRTESFGHFLAKFLDFFWKITPFFQNVFFLNQKNAIIFENCHIKCNKIGKHYQVKIFIYYEIRRSFGISVFYPLRSTTVHTSTMYIHTFIKNKILGKYLTCKCKQKKPTTLQEFLKFYLLPFDLVYT